MRRFNFNISSLLGSNNNSSLYGDFASRKNGSYRKLLKTYYSDQKKLANEIKKTKDELNSQKTDKTKTEKVNPGFNAIKKEVDGLNEAAINLSKEDLWKSKDGNYDIDKISDAIKKFANEYNDLVDQSKNVSSKDITQSTNYMKSLTNAVSKALAKVGVSVDKAGKLSVDEDTLKKADVKTIKSIFGGQSSYGSSIALRAKEISKASIVDLGMYSKNGYLPDASTSMFNKWI